VRADRGHRIPDLTVLAGGNAVGVRFSNRELAPFVGCQPGICVWACGIYSRHSTTPQGVQTCRSGKTAPHYRQRVGRVDAERTTVRRLRSPSEDLSPDPPRRSCQRLGGIRIACAARRSPAINVKRPTTPINRRPLTRPLMRAAKPGDRLSPRKMFTVDRSAAFPARSSAALRSPIPTSTSTADAATRRSRSCRSCRCPLGRGALNVTGRRPRQPGSRPPGHGCPASEGRTGLRSPWNVDSGSAGAPTVAEAGMADEPAVVALASPRNAWTLSRRLAQC
jgi:hypothetical protein